MKLRLLPVVFALFIPISACDNASKSSDLRVIKPSASPVASAAAAPATPSPSVSNSPVAPSKLVASATPSPSASKSPAIKAIASPVATPSPSASKSPTINAIASPVAPSQLTPSPSVANPSPSDITKWYSYSSNGGNYSVKFPEKPIEEEKSSSSPQGKIEAVDARYIDSAKKRVYLTGYANLPVPPGAKVSDFNVERSLAAAQNGIIKGMGATVKSETKITQNGNPGREMIITLPTGSAAKVRIVINPNNLKAYQAIVAANDGNLDFPESKAFLESLNISK